MIHLADFVDCPTPYELDGRPLFWVKVSPGGGEGAHYWLTDRAINPRVLVRWHNYRRRFTGNVYQRSDARAH